MVLVDVYKKLVEAKQEIAGGIPLLDGATFYLIEVDGTITSNITGTSYNRINSKNTVKSTKQLLPRNTE